MKFRIVFTALFAVVAAGCSQPATEPGGADDSKVIGAALLTQSHVFYQDMVAAMEDEAEAQGFTLRVQYCDMDGAKQNDQIETFILQGVDALIVAPHDSSAVGAVIDDARAADIPVFTADIAADGANVVSHVASDNVEGGRLAAEYLAKLLDGSGKVAIIDHPEVRSVIDRVAGFEEVMANYPEIEIVAKVPGGGLRDKALRAAQDLLQTHPELDGIFGINDDSALGALAAIEERGLENDIVIIGFDGTPEARDAIREGSALKADVVQHPEKIGRTTIRTIAAYFEGNNVPALIPVEVNVIDQEILAQESQT